MTGRRADTHGYVEKGKDSRGSGRETGAEMCSLAVAEDFHPAVTPAPHAWKRPVQSNSQGTERLLQDVSGYPQAAPEPWERR